MSEDFYNILEVSKEASQDDIKKSFRNLSKKYHPDLNPDNKEAEEKFKRINEAYSVLSDPQKKQQYDNRNSGFGNFGGFGGFNAGNGGFDFFSDLFNFHHNNGRQNNQNPRGSDLRIRLNLTLEEIVKGSVKNITYKRNACCKSCNGNGSKNGNSLKNCNNCGGGGFVLQNIQTPFGRIQNTKICNVCQGNGKIINHICNDCGARGIYEKTESIQLSIPKGIIDGFVYKIESGGNYNSNSNSTAGDLIVVCHIAEHDVYTRNNLDLHRDIFINLIDAIRGSNSYRIRIFDEDLLISIDPNTQNGHILRLKGKGLPGNSNLGDLYLHVNIFLPKNLDSDTIEKLNFLADKLEPKENEIDFESGSLKKSLKISGLFHNN